jgi:predicted metal-dependent peptidase
MLMVEPLFGHLILRLDLEDAGTWCATAATNGHKLFYNRAFVDRLTLDELIFVMSHEVRHVLFEHIGRRGTRQKDLWNMAIDFICNYGLVRDGIGKMPKSGLYDPRYNDELTSEEVYDLLIQDGITIRPSLDMHLEIAHDEGDLAEPRPELAAASEAMEEIRDEFIADMARTAQMIEPGKIPLGMRRFIDRLTPPQFNWRQIICSHLRSVVRFDYTYARASRRSWTSHLVLPGQEVMERVDAVAWLDGSASTTPTMITAFLSECAGIMATFRDFTLTIGTFDTAVYSVMVFTPSNANQIMSYPFKGGGGTKPSVCWTYMREQHMRPDKILMFTDGLVGNDWGDADLADTLFVIHSNPRIIASHGQTLYFS